ncbi:MAG: hypothetical protein ACI9OJ_005433, partial [Myxococcota bacterium]
AFHHIMPIIAEASIHLNDLTRARQIGQRMRTEAESVGHPLGLAWADACDALVTWLEHDVEAGALALRRAVEALEAIPIVYDAARLRRQLAKRLAELGDREEALKQLRHVHGVFTRIGAERELKKTVDQFGEAGEEPPV